MKKNNELIILIIFLVAITLIGFGWFVFHKSIEIVSDFDAESVEKEADVAKIRILAKENLNFFPLDNNDNIFKQFQNNPQYRMLNSTSTYINLNYRSNHYPFKVIEELVPKEKE